MSQLYCPVDEATRAWLDYRWAWLCRQFGTKGLRQRPLVQASPEFFPDSYEATPEDVEKLVHRVARYMEIDPATLELHYYEESRNNIIGDSFHGSAGMYRKNEKEKFEIWLEISKLNRPKGVIATIAHELGHVLLLGQERVGSDGEDHEPLTDLLTVFMGLGAFPANNSITEHYWDSEWYPGHLPGWSIGKQGYLSMNMFGYAFALFARTRHESVPAWLKHLRLDVRKACQQTLQYLPDAFDPIAAISPPVPYPIAADGNKSPSERLEPSDELNEHDAELVCTYCGSPLDVTREDNGEHINRGSGLCMECLWSMKQSDDTPPATSASEKTDAQFNRFALGILLGLMAFVILGNVLTQC